MNVRDKTIPDTFWLNDISILFVGNRLIEFYPTTDMSKYEKMNAITRLSIYISILLFLYNRR